jgi:hypothetical protein
LKKGAIFLLLVLIPAASFALEFRRSSWMMSREEVIASEPGRILWEKTLPGQLEIVYRTMLDGIPAVITYTLENDRLLSASYTFRKDADRRAFDYMRQDLASRNGAPTFEEQDLAGWRLERTEIALAHLPDGTSCVVFWEKGYFRRINTPPGMTDLPQF